MILNRAAVVGPFTGASLQVAEPGFDKPSNLALKADGPRVEACISELVEGLLFREHSPKEALLEFTNLQAKTLGHKPLVTLRAPSRAQVK